MHGGRGGAALALLLAATVLIAGWASPRLIPFNMDEFVHYHALGCAAFPLSRQQAGFEEGCGQYDLALPFTSSYLPLRSYLYIGSLPALPFAPFWKLIDAPVAARTQGAVFLLLAAGLGARLLRVRFAVALVAMLVYPVYALAFVVDTGPLGISVALLLAALLLVRESLRRPALAALAGLVVFLGLFVKLSFVWWLPALGLFFLREALPRAHPKAAGLLLATTALPLLLLLAATDRDGVPYYRTARVGRVVPDAMERVVTRMTRYLADGSVVAPRTLRVASSPLDVLPAVVAAGILAAGLVFARGHRGAIGFWLALAVLTFGILLLARTAWPHHVACALVFLALALAVALDGLTQVRAATTAAVLAVTLAYWGTLIGRLPQARELPDADRAKDRLLELVRARGLDRETVQVHAAWGTYYIAHLFGDPRQCVVYARDLARRPDRVAAAKAAADALGRGVLVIGPAPPEPELAGLLGPPLSVQTEQDWSAARYVR